VCEWELARGELAEGERMGRKAREVAQRIGDRQHRTYLLALLARFAAEAGQARRAGLLWAGVELEEEQGRVGQWEDERDAYATPVLSRADDVFEAGRAEGRLKTVDELVEVALSAID
jgi:hypothetical protein